MSIAQQTIGTIPLIKSERDAVHIGVMQVRANNHLSPGEPVDIIDGILTLTSFKDSIGIVDPFLPPSGVISGDLVWIFLHPNSVTGMRHAWEHPKLDKVEKAKISTTEKAKASSSLTVKDKVRSVYRDWLVSYANSLGVEYEYLMESAQAKWDKNLNQYIDVPFEEAEKYEEFWRYWREYYGYSAGELPDEFCCEGDVYMMIELGDPLKIEENY